MSAPVIMWFRDDLRLADNPALRAAADTGRPLICVYVHDEASRGVRPLGGAARWWLHGSLAALDASLAAMGGRLLLLRGAAAETVEACAVDVGASAVYWNRRYDETGRPIDTIVKAALERRAIAAESFNGHLLHEPWMVLAASGAPFRVFTAYWRAACRVGSPAMPLPAPESLSSSAVPDTFSRRCVELKSLSLEPTAPDWAQGLRATWERGETGAGKCLDAFLASAINGYAAARDRPAAATTSRLSPYLRFGNISPRQIWHAAQAARATDRASERDIEKFLSEIGWREFSYNLLYHNPDIARRNLQAKFDAMRWRQDRSALRAWQRGLTGYPLIDAGMRELWATGWMHNRVRMVVASFLVKHLLIDWREGEAWFWDTLVDADPANNPASWQWVAGSGADAAPFFRIFNPVLQGENFDPDGAYVKRWIPELAHLAPAVVHRPSMTSRVAGYPAPVIDHREARERAMEAWRALR